MSKVKNFVWAGIMLALFVLLAVLLLTVDVTTGGVEGSNIGLSFLNVPMKNLLGTSRGAYTFSKYLGLFGLLCVAVVAASFLIRIIGQKSFKALTKKEYELGGLYFVTAVLYVIFNKILINYRPIIKWDEEKPESSFPSSHTVMAIVIFGSLASIAGDYFKNDAVCKFLKILCVIFAILIVVGRTLSGVHWFTDIIGGVFLGFALLLAYMGLSKE